MKFRIFIMAVLMIFAVTVTTFAEERDLPMMKDFGIEVIEIESYDSIIVPFSLSVKSIEEHIYDECKNHSEIIYFQNYNITIEELSDLISAHSEFMIYAGGFTAAVYTNTGYVAYFYPEYLFDSAETDEQARTLISEKIQYYVDYAKGLSDDVLEQLLLAHDKLIYDVSYDFEFDELSFHAYGMLANGKGVCQAYAEIVYMMARKLGIEAWFCSSKGNGEIDINGETQTVGHIWNYIKLDGEWYHLDATWNDPDANEKTAGLYDTAYHRYFLVTDESMSDHETEYEWIITLDEKPVCDSDKYEKNYLFNINAPFTTEYNDGYFNAEVTINNRSDVFRTKTLNTDAVIVSDGYIESNIYYIFYGFTKDIEDTSIIFSAEKGGNLQDAKVMIKDAPISRGIIVDMNISLSSIPYCDGGNNCFYVWSLQTLEPYAKKVYMK